MKNLDNIDKNFNLLKENNFKKEKILIIQTFL